VINAVVDATDNVTCGDGCDLEANRSLAATIVEDGIVRRSYARARYIAC
jgi:hypothetical protein